MHVLHLAVASVFLIAQAVLFVSWFSTINNGHKAPIRKGLSIVLIVAQLTLFCMNLWIGGVSLVANGTGVDEFTHTQMLTVATLAISGVGWLFFTHRAHKLLN